MISTEETPTYFIQPMQQASAFYGKNLEIFKVIMSPRGDTKYVPQENDVFYYDKLNGTRLLVKQVEDAGINIYHMQILTMNVKDSIDKKWFKNIAWFKL